jgi:hypothetical protein
MHLDFMKPDIWDGLVLGTVLIGLSLAVLRLMDDLNVYRRKRDQERKSSESFLERYTEETHKPDTH